MPKHFVFFSFAKAQFFKAITSSNFHCCSPGEEPSLICDPQCDVNADCTNFTGIPECMCKDGFDGNGITCTGKSKCSLEVTQGNVNLKLIERHISYDS